MLSVLIPCYNYDCRKIARSLSLQSKRLSETCEIIIGDDASPDLSYRTLNTEINSYPNCRYIVNAHNLGRAAHRNYMAVIAKGEWLLFIDCDSEVCDDMFLERYMRSRKCDVICGGLCTPEVNPCPEATLRFKYERNADKHRSASERSLCPYMQLTAFNLMIKKNVFMDIKFDEDCREYGYEDALLGTELESRGIEILHIDNPLMHVGLEPNNLFLSKSETALRTLHGLKGKMKGHSHVENMANKLVRNRLDGLYTFFYKMTKKMMKANLMGKHPSLLIFSLYKLGFYLCLKRKG